MKLNQSLTAAITAAALVAGAGFAYAQTAAPQVTNTPGASSAQGPLSQNQGTSGASGSTDTNSGSMNSNSTMQAQPSTSGTTSMDNSATTSVDTTLEPRADRN